LQNCAFPSFLDCVVLLVLREVLGYLLPAGIRYRIR